MNIKEFINKVTLYNDGWGFEELCEALERCTYCEGCPFYKECNKPENIGISCADFLKKHLTIN